MRKTLINLVACTTLGGAFMLQGCEDKPKNKTFILGTVINEVWSPNNTGSKSYAFAIETDDGRVLSYSADDPTAMDAKLAKGDYIRFSETNIGYWNHLASSNVEVIKRAESIK